MTSSETFLLDVNVLVALLDPNHVHHERAHGWFEAEEHQSWMSCPITQNGVLRVVSHPRYSNCQPVPIVADSLRSLLAVGRHIFVPDSMSLLGAVDVQRILSSRQITDTYLIALALAHGARLATFDTKIVTAPVRGGAAVLATIT